MFIESLRQRGYTDKDSSMIADAAQKGHTGLVADLLSKADAHKDGGKQQLAEAMVDAKQKIAEASNQLAATQKIEADVTMAEKHVGEAINVYEASLALVSLAQTANSAGIPVEKYVQTVTGMANSLRESGVDGRQVLSSMNALVGRGLRVEDAQSLVQSQARANTNMAKDYNSSAFFGMMAGQGGDPISLISQ